MVRHAMARVSGLAAAVVVIAALGGDRKIGDGALAVPAASDSFAQFAASLDSLASANGIPGLSAAIVRDHRLVWSHGFGYADVERGVPATFATAYRLASVSKPIAATVLVQLVEQGKLTLDAPMRDFRIHPWFEPGSGSWAHSPQRYADGAITVRHVLTHTSEAQPPGSAYKYNGTIFGDLTWVIETVTRQSYPVVMRERIFEPLAMSRSVPGQLVPWGDSARAALARPYAVRDGQRQPGTYPGFGIEPDVDVRLWNLDPAFRLPAATDSARRELLGEAYTPLYSSQTAAGTISTVEDLARFDIALDTGRLVSEATRALMFTPARTPDGAALPYGLGWFVEQAGGRTIVWHYGWFPPTVSALYVKVPDRALTFILLANSDGLSANMAWTARGVRASPYARLFLERFAP